LELPLPFFVSLYVWILLGKISSKEGDYLRQVPSMPESTALQKRVKTGLSIGAIVVFVVYVVDQLALRNRR
jgi:hypothetical protein